MKCPIIWSSWLLQLPGCKQYAGKEDWDPWTGFYPEFVEQINPLTSLTFLMGACIQAACCSLEARALCSLPDWDSIL